MSDFEYARSALFPGVGIFRDCLWTLLIASVCMIIERLGLLHGTCVRGLFVDLDRLILII